MTDTTHLGLPYLDAAQAQKHVTHNDALRMLDALVQLSVIARNVTAPPASPPEGGRWLVGSGGTGAFAGNANNVAAFQDGVWRFFAPQKGWHAYVESDGMILVFDGTNWNDFGLSLHILQNLTQLGIGTAADVTNPVAAKLNAALFTAKATSEGGTGDLRTILNKSAASNTVSQLYQDNYSGRAEVGLTGDDNLHFKVSPDGTTWYDALILSNRAGDKFAPAGAFALGNNALFTTISASGAVTPLSQVQSTGANAAFMAARFSNDANPPRLFFAKSRGTSAGTHGAIASGDDLGGVSLAGSDGTAMRQGATVKAIATGPATANGTPAKFQVDTSDGSGAPITRMEIGSNGNVGIGYGYDPNTVRLLVARLSVSSTVPALAGTLLTDTTMRSSAEGNNRFVYEAFGGVSILNFRGGSGTAAAPSALAANAQLANFGGQAYGATGFGNVLDVSLSFFTAEVFTDTAHGTFVTINTTAIGTASRLERIRVTDGGNLLIGNTTGTDMLTVGGNAVPSADNVYTCGKSVARWSAIWAANGTIQTSDARDKTIVARIDPGDAAAIVDAVEPVKFRWKIGGYDEQRDIVQDGEDETGPRFRENVVYAEKAGQRLHAGFIAQEIKAAMDAHGGDFGAWGLENVAEPNSKQFLRPDQLIPLLWEALRDTRREVAELKAQFAAR